MTKELGTDVVPLESLMVQAAVLYMVQTAALSNLQRRAGTIVAVIAGEYCSRIGMHEVDIRHA